MDFSPIKIIDLEHPAKPIWCYHEISIKFEFGPKKTSSTKLAKA